MPMSMSMSKPIIRNAYQKIRIGDFVSWKTWNGFRIGKVVAKGIGGAIKVMVDHEHMYLYGCDVTTISRKGESVF